MTDVDTELKEQMIHLSIFLCTVLSLFWQYFLRILLHHTEAPYSNFRITIDLCIVSEFIQHVFLKQYFSVWIILWVLLHFSYMCSFQLSFESSSNPRNLALGEGATSILFILTFTISSVFNFENIIKRDECVYFKQNIQAALKNNV